MSVLIGFLLVSFLCFLIRRFLILVAFFVGGFIFELWFVFLYGRSLVRVRFLIFLLILLAEFYRLVF